MHNYHTDSHQSESYFHTKSIRKQRQERNWRRKLVFPLPKSQSPLHFLYLAHLTSHVLVHKLTVLVIIKFLGSLTHIFWQQLPWSFYPNYHFNTGSYSQWSGHKTSSSFDQSFINLLRRIFGSFRSNCTSNSIGLDTIRGFFSRNHFNSFKS